MDSLLFYYCSFQMLHRLPYDLLSVAQALPSSPAFDLTRAGQWGQLVAAPLAVLGIFFTALQIRKNTRATRGQFLLTLDNLADRYDEIYYVFRAAYDSRSSLALDHFTDAEILKIKEYMGFLEHTEVLMAEKVINPRAFDDLFGHRVRALAFNQQVMNATIYGKPQRWKRFSSLINRLRIVPVPNPDENVRRSDALHYRKRFSELLRRIKISRTSKRGAPAGQDWEI